MSPLNLSQPKMDHISFDLVVEASKIGRVLLAPHLASRQARIVRGRIDSVLFGEISRHIFLYNSHTLQLVKGTTQCFLDKKSLKIYSFFYF